MLSVALVACSKSDDLADVKTAAAVPAKDYYFSRVRYFKDNRTPNIDTVWTLHMLDSGMVAHYATQNGYVYSDLSYVKIVGVLWSK